MTSVSVVNEKDEAIAPTRKKINRKYILAVVSILLVILIIVIVSLSLAFWIVPLATEEAAPSEEEFFDLFFGGIDIDGGTMHESTMHESTMNENIINEDMINGTRMNGTIPNGTIPNGTKYAGTTVSKATRSTTTVSKTTRSTTTVSKIDVNVDTVNKMMEEKKTNCVYRGEFSKDRRGSDFSHWGEGIICLTKTKVGFMGNLAVGPDYYLYYATKYVETGREFRNIKAESFKSFRIKSFRGFIQDIPSAVDITKYPALVVWCERYGVYITSTRLIKI